MSPGPNPYFSVRATHFFEFSKATDDFSTEGSISLRLRRFSLTLTLPWGSRREGQGRFSLTLTRPWEPRREGQGRVSLTLTPPWGSRQEGQGRVKVGPGDTSLRLRRAARRKASGFPAFTA